MFDSHGFRGNTAVDVQRACLDAVIETQNIASLQTAFPSRSMGKMINQ